MKFTVHQRLRTEIAEQLRKCCNMELKFWMRVKCKYKTFSFQMSSFPYFHHLWADTIFSIRILNMKKKIPGDVLCCLMAYFISLDKWSYGEAENLNVELRVNVRCRRKRNEVWKYAVNDTFCLKLLSCKNQNGSVDKLGP